MNYFKPNHLTPSCRFDDSKNLCASVKLRKNRRANIKQRLLVVLFLFSLFFIFNANVSQAATVTWDGSDSTDWATDANWVGGTAPTSADDVVIDGVYTNAPTLNLALGAVTVNSLSLGANNASILTLSNANVTDNKLIITGTITIGATGTLTHTANATLQTHVVNLEAADLTVIAGGTISVNAKGYQQSEGPGAGIICNVSGSRGSGHGGNGGTGTEGVGGSAYGSITQPTTIGSGGGKHKTYTAGAGGGAVKLTISGTTTLSGNITANGQNSPSYGSGGSGGSVYITTGTFSGSGSISVNGGKGYYNSSYPGSGGGRIAIHYTTDSSTVSYQSHGGFDGATSTYRMGGAGTIYTKAAAAANGDLLIDNNDYDSLSDVYFDRTPINETITFDTITIQNYGNLDIGDSANITYTTLNWSTKGTITDNGGTLALLSGALIVPETSRLYAYTSRTPSSCTVNGYMETRQAISTAGDFSIGTAGILTTEINTTTQQYVIDITAANFNIASGGTINVNSKGYQRSEGPGQGIDAGWAGGAGYGGNGGNGSAAAGGSAYGSITAPTDIGSGGGDYQGTGGIGGGAVKLTVTGTTTIAGTISANGGNGGYASGGGSGGSVYIITGTLAGAGTISANGGTGNTTSGTSGGGGGGRIAVHYTTNSSSVAYQAYGGLAISTVSRMGGAGTIYTKAAAAANGDMLIDNNDYDSLSDVYFGTTPINETITFDTITIQNYGNLDVGDSANITYTTLDWSTKGIITDNGGTLALLSGTLTVPETSRLYAYTSRTPSSCTVNGYMKTRQAVTTAGDFSIGTAGTLTTEINTTTQQYVIDITAANFTIASGGTINVNEKGYQQSEGPGAGVDVSGGPGGAAHGGDGGDGSSSDGGLAYGSITQPITIGSGGGKNGGYTSGAGGGAVKLTISGTTNLSGSITANGQNSPSHGGGGSGGSGF